MSENKSKIVLDLFYDIASPYAWFGFEIITRYTSRWNIELRLRPADLAVVMKQAGNCSPSTVPLKLAFIVKELKSLGEIYQVPLNLPADFRHRLYVLGTMNALKYISAIQMIQPEHEENLTREFWYRLWSQDVDIHLEENLVEASRKVGISEEVIKEALVKFNTQEVSDRLDNNRQEALDNGVFGLPSFILHLKNGKEMIFGQDRFEIIAKLLGENWEGPLPELSKFKI